MDRNTATAVLLDRHPLWLDAFESVLEATRITVVARTETPTEALRLVQEHGPDLLVVEPEATDERLDGIACLAEARRMLPLIRTIAVSASDDPARVSAAFAAGAAAYVVKHADPDALALAVRQAFRRSVYLVDETIGSATMPGETRPEATLSRRELEIARLVAPGRSNKEVARMLWVTEQTVKFHLANVYRKLGLANRTELSRWVHLHGGVEPVGAVSSSDFARAVS